MEHSAARRRPDHVAEPLVLRDASISGIVVVVRLGENTLMDAHLSRATVECHDVLGIWGFSVLEVPGGDYAELVRLRPLVANRRRLYEARVGDLREAGFPLLPTLGHPHWTVALSEPTPVQFARVREQFTGPLDNPVFAGRSRR